MAGRPRKAAVAPVEVAPAVEAVTDPVEANEATEAVVEPIAEVTAETVEASAPVEDVEAVEAEVEPVVEVTAVPAEMDRTRQPDWPAQYASMPFDVVPAQFTY